MLDKADAGRKNRTYDDARDDEVARGDHPAAACDLTDQKQGSQGRQKGKKNHRRREAADDETQIDGQRGAKGGPGGHADGIGVGQRVFKKCLQHPSRHRKAAAYRSSRDHPGQPDIPDDRNQIAGNIAV
ncbi:hypothetical protein SDC9_193160 [bioreactor metagenome]|uniref:Uncharacterized protein n=1 Tax=bioreactor metagenome TaxID=1076179 RepID=A0A645IDV1_9ZZZZ